MTTKKRARSTTWILLGLVALFAGAGLWFAQREHSAREDALAPTPVVGESEREPTVLAEPGAKSTSRTDATQPTPAKATTVVDTAPAAKPPGSSVEGRVLDITGAPVAGVTIKVETMDLALAPKLAVSGADGSFQFASKKDSLRLIATSLNWRTLRSQVWRADHPLPGFIVVAPCMTLRGEVVDQAGAAVPKAMLSVQIPPTILAQFPQKLDATAVTGQWSQGVDRQGQFNVEGAICVPGSTWEVKCEEFLTRTLPMPEPNTFVPVVLERDPRLLNRSIRGIVVRRGGEPATQAVVRFGEKHAATDSSGAFELPHPGEVSEWMDKLPLIATEAGSQAAIVPEFGRVLRQSPGDPLPQQLVLGPPPLSIRGRVLDGRGQPLVGCMVMLMTPTMVTIGDAKARTVEQWTAGEPTDVISDAHGAFELSGLLDRTYRLQVFDNKTFGRLESEEIPAGSHAVELAFPPNAFVAELTGRVVGRDGQGIGGAEILLSVVHKRVVGPGSGADRFESVSSGGRTMTLSADDGSFLFSEVPRYFAELQVHGKDLIARAVPLKDLDLDRPLVILVDRACKFRIEGLPASTGKLHLLALDAEQKELRIVRSPNSNYGSNNQLELGGDPAEIYTVTEAAVEFVLYATDGTVLGRRPARLVPGSVAVLMW